MRYGHDQHAHPISRRTVLRGAAGLGLGVAAGGSLLSACGSGGDDNEESGPDVDDPLETTSIRLYSVPPANCIAAMYMTEEFLREEGFTDVQYPKFAPQEIVPSWADGAVDFGVFYPAALTPWIADGRPFTVLGGVHLGCWQVIASNPDIKTMRDFKGKTVAMVGMTFIDGIFMAMTLANVGLDVNRDVKVVNPPPAEWGGLLSSGAVDGVLALPPLATDLQAKGIGHVVVDAVTDHPWSEYYCCSPVANRDWMEQHPVAAKRALRAMLRGADAVAADPLAAARLLVDRGYTANYDYTCDVLKKIRYNVWRDFDPVDSIRFYALRLKEAGIIKLTPQEILDRGTDFRYFNQLRKEMRPSA